MLNITLFLFFVFLQSIELKTSIVFMTLPHTYIFLYSKGPLPLLWGIGNDGILSITKEGKSFACFSSYSHRLSFIGIRRGFFFSLPNLDLSHSCIYINTWTKSCLLMWFYLYWLRLSPLKNIMWLCTKRRQNNFKK